MSNVLVLGGTGFVGAHVLRQLSATGHRAISASRAQGTDATNYPALRRAIQDAQPAAIINCAAHVGGIPYVSSHTAEVLRDNTDIAMNLYRAVLEVNPTIKIIQPLSNCSYPGEANTHIEREWFAGPVHESIFGYGFSRKIYWALSHAYHQQYGISTINWLTPNGYGPGDHTDPTRTHALNGIIIRLIQAQRAGDHEFSIWGSGKPTREWGYVEDVARLLVHSVDHAESQIYPVNIAQNKAYSIAEIAEIGARHLGYRVQFTFDTTKPDGAPFKILDNSVFRSKYPTFSFTPLDQGIRTTIEYYKKAL
jgi:GDP-L-fucose synthase